MSGTIVGGSFLGGGSLEKKLVKAFEDWTRLDVNDHFHDEFTEDKWDYPTSAARPGIYYRTKRKSGQIVDSPRDIFDLGDLYRSGRDGFTITQGGTDITASWDWDAKNSSGSGYAWYVHEGLSTNRAPRRWTDVFQQRDLFISSNVSKALRSRIRATMGR